MPDVPNVPGVPALSSYLPSADQVTNLLISDVVSAIASFLFGPVYGIFLDHLPIPVIAADNYVKFEHKEHYEISTYPVEQGSFLSYDKVKIPAEIRVRVSAGGSIFTRQALLNTIDLAMPTTGLYDVVTPEKVYLNYNFVGREMVREADSGAGLISVEITLMEVQTMTSLLAFLTTAVANIAGQSATGYVNTQTVPDNVQNDVSNGVQ